MKKPLSFAAFLGVTVAALALSSVVGFSVSSSPDEDIASLRDAALHMDYNIDPTTLKVVLDGAGPYQRDLLADGRLTFAEYRQAQSDWLACLQASGVTGLTGMPPDGMGRLNQELTIAGRDAFLAYRSAEPNCSEEYTAAVNRVWSLATADLAKAAAKESRRRMAECLRVAGLGPGDLAKDDPTARATYATCVRSVNAQLGVPVSFGVQGDAGGD